MLLAVDVHYKEDYAKTVLLLFEDWTSDIPTEIIEITTAEVLDYEPGFFYKRELPCILEALQKVDLTTIDTIIIDGYVFVDDDFAHGLGGYLYEALDRKIPVVGIAKTKFQRNTSTAVEIFRGESKNPLFVSSIGVALDFAAQKTKAMHGNFRLPHLLKLMDQKTKED